MAVVQGLTHFNYISIGKTLEKLSFNVRESRKYSSPIYDLMLDMVGRIIGQNPETLRINPDGEPGSHRGPQGIP